MDSKAMTLNQNLENLVGERTEELTKANLELHKEIEKQVGKLTHIHKTVLTSWLDVKTQLEKMDKDYISYAKYKDICKRKNISDESNQNKLIDFLRNLGVVLHFRTPTLVDTNVLNPKWVSKGIYMILNDKLIMQKNAILNIIINKKELKR